MKSNSKNRARAIEIPSYKQLKKLYEVFRHAIVDTKTGELTFSVKSPMTEELRHTQTSAAMLLPLDRPVPIQHQFDSDYTEAIAECLSDEPVVYLPRVWTSRVVDGFTQEYSLVEARNFIYDNPEYTVQYGWLLHRYAMWITADFHAAVRAPNGELKLLQQTPGSPLERAVAFIPDNKNKPDFANNSSPALVGLCMTDREDIIHIGNRERVLKRSRIEYLATAAAQYPRKTKMIKQGNAPHQPSQTMDLIGDISPSQIVARMKSAA